MKCKLATCRSCRYGLGEYCWAHTFLKPKGKPKKPLTLKQLDALLRKIRKEAMI